MPRKAQSAYLQVLEKNPNNRTSKELKKRMKNEQKLSFANDKLTPPDWLTAKGKKLFESVVDLYKDTSFLNNADVVTIAQYCDWYSEYISCTNFLKKHKREKDGKPNPQINLKLKISSELDRLARELGLTPSARASLAIHMNDEAEKSEEDEDDF